MYKNIIILIGFLISCQPKSDKSELNKILPNHNEKENINFRMVTLNTSYDLKLHSNGIYHIKETTHSCIVESDENGEIITKPPRINELSSTYFINGYQLKLNIPKQKTLYIDSTYFILPHKNITYLIPNDSHTLEGISITKNDFKERYPENLIKVFEAQIIAVYKSDQQVSLSDKDEKAVYKFFEKL